MNIRNLFRYTLATSALVALTTSCSDKALDLQPIDHFSGKSYWKTQNQATAFMDGIYSHIRSHSFNHTFVLGEVRGGSVRQNSIGADGMTLSYGILINQNLTEDTPYFDNFTGLYGVLTNINLMIARVEAADYIAENIKNNLLAQAYGLRAYIYFDLYRNYGGVPLRLTADVVEGITDPLKLYATRATPKEVMTQIKKDITTSLEKFGSRNSFDPVYKSGTRKSMWSKAATEVLAGQVYLWTSKVTTGDDVADEANLATAKTHLENVVNSYGLGLMSNFADVFDAVNNKGNREVIFAARFAEGEATNSNNVFTYSMNTGFSKNDYKEDGTLFGDALNLQNTGNQGVEYRSGLYDSFKSGDTRRDATFIASYKKAENGLLYRYGTHVRKNIGHINPQGVRVYSGDYIIYRLPEVYLMLAEIANMQGDGASVKKYIDLVRQRAYGASYVADNHGYTPGDFTQNELAILEEKNKEFVQEGQRWYDLRRMTLSKGGKHLVFAIEAAIEEQVYDNTSKTMKLRPLTPVLDEAKEAHEVLYPVDKETLKSEKLILQTPGYPSYKTEADTKL